MQYLEKLLIIQLLQILPHSSISISQLDWQEVCSDSCLHFGGFLFFFGGGVSLILFFQLKTLHTFFFSLCEGAERSFISAPSRHVLFSTQVHRLHVYIRYKITSFVVWRKFWSHHFCVLAEVLGFFFFLWGRLWPFFWGGMVVGTEYKN